MILLFFSHDPETRGDSYPCKAFRWTLQINKWSFGFVHQHQYKDDTWNDSHTTVAEIYLSCWKLGSDHFWYDGEHCSLHLGWIHFRWGNLFVRSCKKCLGENE